MYALIIGDRPRRAASSQEELLLAMTQPLPSLGQRVPGIARDVVALVDKATAYEPDQRFASAAAMRAALGALLGGGRASDSMTHPSSPAGDSAPVRVFRPGALPGSDGALTTRRPVAGSTAAGAHGRRTTVLVAAASAIVRLGRPAARSAAARPEAAQPATLPTTITTTTPTTAQSTATMPAATAAALPVGSTAATASVDIAPRSEPVAAPRSTATGASRSAAAPPAVSSTAREAPASRPARPARPGPTASSSPNLLDNRF
jgi:hypothetical protein